MEDKIIKMLKEANKPLTASDINNALGYNTVDELKELLKVLNKLENDTKIYHTKNDKYILFEDSHLKVGILEGNKRGFGFVTLISEPDIFIAPKNMNGAIHGDKVLVEVISNKGINTEGKILRVVSRDLKGIVGEFYFKKGIGYIHIDDNKINMNIMIPKKKSKGAMNGHKVLVSITKKVDNDLYEGEVIRILGHKNDPGVDILSIVASLNISDTFSELVMNEANNLSSSVSAEDIKGRTDLREEEIFTIDGDDTKDIDDAISIKKLDNGNYLLGVHIADVSSYVKEDSEIDLEANLRGTSVYLADRVIPMLPHLLSNGICSLNPNEDRLTISCLMEIDQNGDIINHDLFKSVIKSQIQMTYNKVNDILERNIIDEAYKPYVNSLTLMAELAKILRKNKERKGYIDFDIKESKIIVDDEGRAIDIKYRTRGVGENLIEDFMIAANETVANHITDMELPFIYRIHGNPEEEKIKDFLRFINVLGYTTKERVNKITPVTIKGILDDLSSKDEYPILSKLMLRSMQKAVYSENNIGHFGLGSDCYTHFTSPIRRYPDLTVHRLLHTYIFNNHQDKDTINYWEHKLPIIAFHSSFAERQSIECEQAVDDMKKAEYMLDHIGEEYRGVISSVMPFGLFVTIPNSVEGLIRLETLGGYYTYDEITMSLVSEQNKKGYRLGDSVDIIVTGASKEARTVDFEIKGGKNGNTKSQSKLQL